MSMSDVLFIKTKQADLTYLIGSHPQSLKRVQLSIGHSHYKVFN